MNVLFSPDFPDNKCFLHHTEAENLTFDPLLRCANQLRLQRGRKHPTPLLHLFDPFSDNVVAVAGIRAHGGWALLGHQRGECVLKNRLIWLSWKSIEGAEGVIDSAQFNRPGPDYAETCASGIHSWSLIVIDGIDMKSHLRGSAIIGRLNEREHASGAGSQISWHLRRGIVLILTEPSGQENTAGKNLLKLSVLCKLYGNSGTVHIFPSPCPRRTAPEKQDRIF